MLPVVVVDVSQSNLQPTAQEFQPGMAAYPVSHIAAPTAQSHSLQHTGAVKRNNQCAKNAQPLQPRPSHRKGERMPPREREKIDDDYAAGIGSQGERKQSIGHSREGGRKTKKEEPRRQGQNGANQTQFHAGNGNYHNSCNSSYPNEFRDKVEQKRNYIGGDDDDGGGGGGRRSGGSFRDRKSHRTWESQVDNRVRDRDNKENRRLGKTSYKNWREGLNKSVRKAEEDIAQMSIVPSRANTKFANNGASCQKRLDAASQRERLEYMLTHHTMECLVCCERVHQTDRIWSCKQCFHILHLACVRRWAKSSKLEAAGGWRCPACQNVLTAVPNEYRCYCDKYAEPKFEPGFLAHSCGEVCRRSGRNCDHTCTLLCHPGPCPDCAAMVQRACGCGATQVTVKCNSNLPLTCDGVCSKLLSCELHFCTEKCHNGPCKECTESVVQECHCGKQGRKVVMPCVVVEQDRNVQHYACDDVCGKALECGNHNCIKLCHSGLCSLCPTDPKRIKTCPCGRKDLSVVRTSCLDPIPCCKEVCGKVLSCGQPSEPHRCEEICHNGECPQCPAATMVRCRCGHMYKEIACRDLAAKADDARCQKKCTKMRICSKHRCNQYCCIEVEHRCPMLCNRNLGCGLHKCETNCHSGRCEPCWRTSFEELHCECGASVIYPPVPCGTRAPACNNKCSRVRACGHEPHHNCHTGPCPPCTLFTTKLCHGGHESRGTIPCHQEDFSCGMPCSADMPCGRHRCVQVCHKGSCPQPCAQPCAVPKPNCEHLCHRPCHALRPCPIRPCKETVVTTCPCGLRSSTNICMNMTVEYQKSAMLQLLAASKAGGDGNPGPVDINDMMLIMQMRGAAPPHRILECNEECKLVERNRRMAIGLQLRNPDLSAKLAPRYTDYLKQWAKKDARFCQHVHDKLTELVQRAKQSKQKSRSHSFECMNREKRQFVHELCEHFGVESAAYDAEPNRNIVATASREKSWLPSCSLIELVQRESGQRKVPGPVWKAPWRGLNAPRESVSLRLPSARVANSNNERSRPATPPGEFVDYFNNPPPS